MRGRHVRSDHVVHLHLVLQVVEPGLLVRVKQSWNCFTPLPTNVSRFCMLHHLKMSVQSSVTHSLEKLLGFLFSSDSGLTSSFLLDGSNPDTD